MKRFIAFEDSALNGRFSRLQKSQADLEGRVHARIAEAEREGRWVPSDPMYQRLSSALKQVRRDLRDVEEEQLRRRADSLSRSASRAKHAQAA